MSNFRQFRKIERGEFIIVAGDTASGGLDNSATQFLSKQRIDVPLVYHSKQTTTQMTNDLVPALNMIYDITGVQPIVAYERNAGGSYEMERLATLNREGKFRLYMEKGLAGVLDPAEPKRYGWTTNTATRPKMLEDLKNAIDSRTLRVYDERTVNEMFSFVVVQTSSAWKAQAEQNSHDDLIMSLAIAWQLYQTEQMPTNRQDMPVQNFNKYRIG